VTLRIVPASPDRLVEWRAIHNEIIPTAPLNADEVTERATRHRLTLAYDGDVLVGNATVRPPVDEGTATVIVRILPEHRRRGLGSAYLEHELAEARALEPQRIETVVLASNEDGLAFALAHGFVEVDRYLLEGDTIPFIDLRLTAHRPG
jgi:GNAT superfamily N-acetyltransferase